MKRFLTSSAMVASKIRSRSFCKISFVVASAAYEADAILMDLNDCYLLVRSALFIRDPLFEVKDSYNTVSREESHRGVPDSSGVIESKMNASSFTTKTFNNISRRSFNNNNNNTKKEYDYYKKFSTPVKQGFNANIDVKDNEKLSSRYSCPGFTSTQMKKLLSFVTPLNEAWTEYVSEGVTL
ncbi:hypothetical protein Tco_0481728 [Tanacetum coccineum]